LSDGTVQFTATEVFNSQRPRCSTSPPYSLIEDTEQRTIDTMASAKKYLIDRCYFQYLPICDLRMRGQIEGLLSYLLDVRYIHEEH